MVVLEKKSTYLQRLLLKRYYNGRSRKERYLLTKATFEKVLRW